jgi:hypothetical protein
MQTESETNCDDGLSRPGYRGIPNGALSGITRLVDVLVFHYPASFCIFLKISQLTPVHGQCPEGYRTIQVDSILS